MFRTLLIANRGEIACRIVRTARRLGIETVAVFSDADADALHVRTADRALRIGPRAGARQLSQHRAHHRRGAGGRRARRSIPATASCRRTRTSPKPAPPPGLIFVGPPAGAMRAMGSKSAAKTLMERSGVPLLPGYHGDNQDPAFLADQARTRRLSGGHQGGLRRRRARHARRVGAATTSMPRWMRRGRKPPRRSATTAC